ncbi:hypothetical protein OUZ56_020963 [Daphnia magna]|uniref:Uncharacterized protein n=1 Tax=Daphnia magna TaxID=35525 RepID=A0ABQ9ZG39_9CRUS|nr:hypothetical protein OUZ56_020963 [Daphnia magna]
MQFCGVVAIKGDVDYCLSECNLPYGSWQKEFLSKTIFFSVCGDSEGFGQTLTIVSMIVLGFVSVGFTVVVFPPLVLWIEFALRCHRLGGLLSASRCPIVNILLLQNEITGNKTVKVILTKRFGDMIAGSWKKTSENFSKLNYSHMFSK